MNSSLTSGIVMIVKQKPTNNWNYNHVSISNHYNVAMVKLNVRKQLLKKLRLMKI